MDGPSDNSVVEGLPEATATYSAIVDGQEHTAVTFSDSGAQPSRLIDMGRFMQRVEINQVGYSNGTAQLDDGK